PARNALERARDWLVKTIAMREFGKGTSAFNETRQALGLPRLDHPFDQLKSLARILVMTSDAFDFHSTDPMPGLTYVGPALDDPAWTERWTSPWERGDRRPLVLVGFSTTFQNQPAGLSRPGAGARGADYPGCQDLAARRGPGKRREGTEQRVGRLGRAV